jgi:hypothetical protein
MLRLHTITFDRTVGRRPAALPLRRHSSDTVPTHDWAIVSDAVSSTPVAYARTFPANVRPTLTVELMVTAPMPARVQVRARSGNPFPLGHTTAETVSATTPGHVATVVLAVDAHSLGVNGVADVTLAWEWQVSVDGGRTWTPFDDSAHRIFILLDEPQLPWGRPGMPHRIVPWLDVLDVACRWAHNAVDHEGAADAVTAEVHRLGGRTIRQQSGRLVKIQYGEAPAYAASQGRFRIFSCSRFIALIRLHPTSAYTINCLDCTNAVMTFGTALGVDFVRCEFRPANEDDRLQTNPVWLLGKPSPSREVFRFHSVVSRSSNAALSIWDACCKVDFDAAPGQSPPADWGLAAGVSLEAANGPAEVGYRQRFLAAASPAAVLRPVPQSYPDKAPPGAIPIEDREEERRRLLFLRTIGGLPRTALPPGVSVDTVMRALGVADAEPRDTLQLASECAMVMVSYALDSAIGSTLRLGIALAPTASYAADVLFNIVDGYAAPVVPVRDVGDVGFYCPDDESIVFVRGQLVVHLLNDPDRNVSIRPHAFALDSVLAAHFPQAG